MPHSSLLCLCVRQTNRFTCSFRSAYSSHVRTLLRWRGWCKMLMCSTVRFNVGKKGWLSCMEQAKSFNKRQPAPSKHTQRLVVKLIDGMRMVEFSEDNILHVFTQFFFLSIPLSLSHLWLSSSFNRHCLISHYDDVSSSTSKKLTRHIRQRTTKYPVFCTTEFKEERRILLEVIGPELQSIYDDRQIEVTHFHILNLHNFIFHRRLLYVVGDFFLCIRVACLLRRSFHDGHNIYILVVAVCYDARWGRIFFYYYIPGWIMSRGTFNPEFNSKFFTRHKMILSPFLLLLRIILHLYAIISPSPTLSIQRMMFTTNAECVHKK